MGSAPPVESEVHKAAFEAYWKMGPSRSVKALAAIFRSPEDNSPVSRNSLTQWRKWFDWQQRIDDRNAAATLQKQEFGIPTNKVEAAVKALADLELLGPPLTPQEVTEHRKVQFIEAYWKCAGNRTLARQMTGFSQSMISHWLKDDPAFKQAMSVVDTAQCDYVESKLLLRIDKGDTRAIIFYLTNRRPDRWNPARFDKPGMVAAVGTVVTGSIRGELVDLSHAQEIFDILQSVGAVTSGRQGPANDRLPVHDDPKDDEVHPAHADAETGSLPPSS